VPWDNTPLPDSPAYDPTAPASDEEEKGSPPPLPKKTRSTKQPVGKPTFYWLHLIKDKFTNKLQFSDAAFNNGTVSNWACDFPPNVRLQTATVRATIDPYLLTSAQSTGAQSTGAQSTGAVSNGKLYCDLDSGYRFASMCISNANPFFRREGEKHLHKVFAKDASDPSKLANSRFNNNFKTNQETGVIYFTPKMKTSTWRVVSEQQGYVPNSEGVKPYGFKGVLYLQPTNLYFTSNNWGVNLRVEDFLVHEWLYKKNSGEDGPIAPAVDFSSCAPLSLDDLMDEPVV
jgi:hypothetical protein